MGFLSGIVHAIGNGINDVEGLFGGGNKKKNQPAQAQPQKAPQQQSFGVPQNNTQLYQPNQSFGNFQNNNPQIYQQPQQQQAAPQAPKPYQANLVRLAQQNQPDASTLQKVQSNGAAPAQPAQPPAQHASILHDITHNPVTNLIGNVVKPTAEFGNALLHVPQAIGREIQNKPVNDIQQKVFGTTDSGKIAKKIVGDTVNTALLAVAPGADSAAVTAATALKPAALDAASALAKAGYTDAAKQVLNQASKNLLVKSVGHGVSGAAVGATGNAATAFGDNKSAGDVIKSGLEGTGAGVLFGAGGTVAGPLLRKAGNVIADETGNVINAAKPGVQTAIRNTGNALTKAKDAAGNFIDTAGNKISNAANAVSNFANTVNTKTDNLLARLSPDEVSPGVKSVNPNGQADVAAHMAANHPELAPQPETAPVEAPTPQQGPLVSQEHPDAAKIVQQAQPAPAPVPKPEPVVAPEPREVPNYISPHKNGKASVPGNNQLSYTTGDPNLDSIVNDSIIAHKGTASTAGTRGAALDQAGISQADRAEIRNIATAHVDKQTGKISAAGVKKINAVLTRPAATAGPLEPTIPTELTQAPETAPPTTKAAPVVEKAPPGQAPAPASLKSPTGRTAPNAPEYTASLEKQLKTAEKGIPASANEHEVLSNKQLSAAGKEVTDQMSDEQLLDKFGSGIKFNGHGEAAVGNAALDRLGKIYEAAGVDPSVKERAMAAIKNIIDAGGEQQSNAGRVMNYGQEMLAHLPRPAKVAYYIKHIDELNLKAGADEASLLKENPAKAAAVEAKLNEFLAKDDAHSTAIAEHSSTLQKGADAATRDEVTTKQLQEAYDAKKALNTERQKNAGDFSDYYKTLVPDNKSIGQKLGDWQRTAMLSSPTGRINALGGTGLNVVDKGLKQGVSGLLGKAYNAIRGTGNGVGVADTGSDLRSLGKGFVAGLKKSGNIVKGQTYVDNPDAVMGATGARNTLSELPNSGGTLPTRLVKAAVSGHQNLSVGVKDSELLRQTRKAGIQEGLSGEDLDKYTLAHAGNPDGVTAAKAQEAHDTINNLDKNPITDALTAVGNGLAKIPKVGPLIKNQVIPFSHFVGGNIWNTITDRNLVAAATKTVAAAVKGDAQGVIDGLGSTAVESGKAYGMGWLLTQHGILTNKDAQGNSYDGTYLHLGNRYIPVTSLGSFAPSIILGNAAYNGFHSPNSKGNVVKEVADSAGKALTGAYKGYSGQQLLGGGTTLAGPFSQAFGKSGNSVAPLSKVATNVAGQFIPAATGDINAVLNNGVGAFGYTIPGTDALNKTHEAANTKVVDPNSKSGKASDPVKSAEASLLNKIPGASQALPRETGVASQDLLDKVTKGNNASKAQQQAAASALSKQQIIDSYAKDANKILDVQNTPSDILKKVEAADKKSFEASNQQKQTIHGIVYEKNVNGKTTTSSQTDNAFATSQGGVDPVQRAKDTEAFKKSGKQMDTINGTVYERSDDGKVKATEQKDYDYKNADEGMKTAKDSGDYTGYQQHAGNLLKNISDQLQNPHLSSSQVDALVNKATAIHKQTAEYDAYGGFSKPKDAETFKGVGQINGARQYTPEEQKKYGTTSTGYVQEIQRNAAKYNIDPQALIAVSTMEGLGGGVGDGGHAFGPFQMNDAGGVLTGKFSNPNDARAYAESPKGIEDAISQISKVAGGLKGKAAIEAIVRNFERPADPDKEVAGANEVYDGGTANLSNDSSGTSIIQDPEKKAKADAVASAAAKLIKDNNITNLPQLQKVLLGQLTAKQIASVPILQKILPADLIKQRSISVAKTRA